MATNKAAKGDKLNPFSGFRERLMRKVDPSKNVIDMRPKTAREKFDARFGGDSEREITKEIAGPYFDRKMDANKRGEPSARRSGVKLPDWYKQERALRAKAAEERRKRGLSRSGDEKAK